MGTVRLISPAVQISGVKHEGTGKTYNDAPGTAVDYEEHIAQRLEANGYTRVAISGTTAQRPANTAPPGNVYKGQFYYDTTLTKLIVYDGKLWRDPVNGNSV